MVTTRIRLSLAERFWIKVDKSTDGGCWVWTASRSAGYGRFAVTPTHLVMAHRFSYELLRGAIPGGLVLDHLCRNTACVNPDHLEPVTNAENVRRGIGFAGVRSRQTHCIHGHEFTPENTWVDPMRGTRSCRACNRIRTAARRRKARQA